MVAKYSHLFFSFYKCVEQGKDDEANRIELEQENILQQLKLNGYDVKNLLDELKTQRLFKSTYETIVIFTDGGVRNNHDMSQTSIAASAFAIYGDQKMLKHDSFFIGDKITIPSGAQVEINSTLAEYHGLLKALQFVTKYNVRAKRIIFLTDCETMVQHIKAKRPQSKVIREMCSKAISAFTNLHHVELRHIPRNQNKFTDKLVNQLLNKHERRAELCKI